MLPDTYNWKPYWGNPEPGAWGDPPAIKILHIHGPKFQESLCVLKYLGVNNMTTASNATLLTEIKDLCNYKRSQFSMQLLLDANKVCVFLRPCVIVSPSAMIPHLTCTVLMCSSVVPSEKKEWSSINRTCCCVAPSS